MLAKHSQLYETKPNGGENNFCSSLIHFLGILGLQPRDKAAMLVVNTKEIFLLNLHQNKAHFPAERNAFVLDHQHGRRDVSCKPAMSDFASCDAICK